MDKHLLFEYDAHGVRGYMRFCFFAKPEDVMEFGVAIREDITALHLAQFKNVDGECTRTYIFCLDSEQATHQLYDYDEPAACSFSSSFFPCSEENFWLDVRAISEHAGVLDIFESAYDTYTQAQALNAKLTADKTCVKRAKI